MLKGLRTCIPMKSPVEKKIDRIFYCTKQQKHANLKLECASYNLLRKQVAVFACIVVFVVHEFQE